jgi:NAD(P)-dependent dehydrogenase (short-subunit alcohol dehydrogenase family)
MKLLEGKLVLVFGASSGVGLATAELLRSEGAKLIITGRRQGEIDTAVAKVGGDTIGFAVDGKDESAVRACFERVGEIDHLVIPAGATNRGGSFVDVLTMKAFRDTFEGKFWVQMNVAHEGARHVRKGGSITFISGGASHRAIPGMSNIAAVNAAIEAVVPVLAVELGPTRVNAIAPGTLATSYWTGVSEEQQRAIFERTAGLLPAGRVGTAEDIARTVLFLVTTSFATGSVVRVDGGLAHANV